MTDSDCIFCKIARGEMSADVTHQDHDVVAFRDINPQAPTHVLVIPRRHVPTVNDLDEGNVDLVGKLFLVAKEQARRDGLADDGYRLVLNTGSKAGQSVFHIHLHLLGGRPMRWPPG